LFILRNTRSGCSHLLPARLLVIASIFLFLASSGSAQQKTSNGSFASDSTEPTATLVPETATSLSGVTLIPATVVGGNPSRLRIVLSQAAPAGGVQVALHSSDPAVVVTPSSVTIPRGHVGVRVVLTTVAVTTTHSVTLTASYNGGTAGATLTVNPSTAPFTVKLQTASLTVDQGSSGTDVAVTTAGAGFDNSLTLDAPNSPAGVTVSFTPSVIAAPGTGSSQVDVSVDNTVAAGKYSIKITASDGSITRAATLTLTVSNGSSPGPVGPLTGCIRTMNGHKYQGVEFSMNEAATVDFNGNLYYGATCDPNQQADEFGYGTPLNLGGFGYIFWFRDFPDQLNTSAIWTVGNQTSQCVDYTKAPDCS
jgi:hypothetical protein